MNPIEARASRLLTEMSLLSEVGAVQHGSGRGGAARSAPPPGVRFGGRDLRDLSLATYWQARFESARSHDQLVGFLLLAERDLARAQRRQPDARGAESREAREERIVEDYAGLSAVEAALIEGCSESAIQKARKRHGRDPQHG